MQQMVLTVFGTCVLRLVWVYTVNVRYHTFHALLMVYPITWIITGILVVTAAVIVARKAFSRAVPDANGRSGRAV